MLVARCVVAMLGLYDDQTPKHLGIPDVRAGLRLGACHVLLWQAAGILILQVHRLLLSLVHVF